VQNASLNFLDRKITSQTPLFPTHPEMQISKWKTFNARNFHFLFGVTTNFPKTKIIPIEMMQLPLIIGVPS